MRIIYLHQYFNTPDMVGSTRSFEMGRRLVEGGHEVHMVTSNVRPDADTLRGWYETEERGIRVHWLPVPYSNKAGPYSRLRAFLKFSFRAMGRATSLDGDLVFATSTPLTIALPGLYASWRRKVPFVFEVRDLWPEAPIQVGALRSPFLIALARRLERLAYHRAKRIVALTPGMREGILAAGVSPDKVTVIPNSSDLEDFSPDLDGSAFRDRLGAGNRFLILYFGTIGRANGLNMVLDAARELKDGGEEDVLIALVGDGSEKVRLQGRADAESLDNVIFVEPVPKREAPSVVAAADATLVIFENLPVLHTSSPNKLFDSLAAGKPVLTNLTGWIQSLVEVHETGLCVKPDSAVDLANKILVLRDDPDRCRRFGVNARRLAEEKFSRDILADRLQAVLEAAAA